jgi:hypothetical protein
MLVAAFIFSEEKQTVEVPEKFAQKPSHFSEQLFSFLDTEDLPYLEKPT